LLFYKTSRF